MPLMSLLVDWTQLRKESLNVSISMKGKVKAAQSCPTLRDPMDYIVNGTLQARILEWVAFPFFTDRTQVSRTAGRFFTSWTTREVQEYWSGLPFPSPADPGPRNQTRVSCIAGRFFTKWAIKKAKENWLKGVKKRNNAQGLWEKCKRCNLCLIEILEERKEQKKYFKQ